jgi:pentatricopeptide repeat protein
MDALHISRPPGVRVNPLPLNRLIPSPPSDGWKTPDEYFDRPNQWSGAGFVNLISSNLIPCRLGGFQETSVNMRDEPNLTGLPPRSEYCPPSGGWKTPDEYFDRQSQCPGAGFVNHTGYAQGNPSPLSKSANSGGTLDVNICTSLIRAHINAGKNEEAFELFDEMKRCNVKPNADIYHLLMGAHINAGKIMEAVELLNEMKRCKVKPNANTYHLLIEAHINAGEKQEAFELFNEMKTCKFKSRADTYHLLIKAYIKENCIDEARILYNEMPQHGVKPAKRSLSALCNAYARNNQIDKARDFSRQQFQSTAVTK